MSRLGISLLLFVSAAANAAGYDDPLHCNGQRSSATEGIARITPDFGSRCFALGMRYVREATGHDYNLVEAEGIFVTLKRLRPRSAYGFIGLAEVNLRKRELAALTVPIYEVYEEAIRATRAKPTVPQAFVTLGRVSLLMGCVVCADRAAKNAEKLGVSGPRLRILQSEIAERLGDTQAAEAILLAALRIPAVPLEERSKVHVQLGSLYARSGNNGQADVHFAQAIAETPKRVTPYLKRAAFELYLRGDANAAAEFARQANRIAPVAEAKHIVSIAEYLEWARQYLGHRPTKDIKRIAQVSFVAPEEAFVVGARYPALSKIVEAMSKAAVIRGTEARDRKGNTALIASAMGNNSDVARLLISRKADVNAENASGERALSFFIVHGNRAAVTMLLRAGADVDYVDNDGNSPLMLAVRRSDARLVMEFLRKKVATSVQGMWSAGDLLSVAAMMDDAATITALLESGVAVDSPDRSGFTALVTATYWGSKSVAKLLLEKGANPAVARRLAEELGSREMLEVLKAGTKRAI